jgi:hypothetical protein
MPYTQYCNDPTDEKADSLFILMSNRDTITRNASYKYSITGLSVPFNKTYDGGQDSIRPFYKNGFVTYVPFAHPPVPFLLPISGADSASFLVRHVLKDLTPGSTFGDTLERVQRFQNYYAYDDGTPELGYGINGNGAQMALRFKLNQSPDTLRGVYIYFNRTIQSTSGTDVLFYLTVWNDNNGLPGDTIYSRIEKVIYSDSLNQLVGYRIHVPLQITGTFYVGTIQTTTDNLNIGYDKNNNAQANLFYNALGYWNVSAFAGALMLRPIIGKPITLGISPVAKSSGIAAIYPNPCSSGTISIEIPGLPEDRKNTRLLVTVYDLAGSTLITATSTGIIDVSTLPQGMYIVGIKDIRTQQTWSAKLIINR